MEVLRGFPHEDHARSLRVAIGGLLHVDEGRLTPKQHHWTSRQSFKSSFLCWTSSRAQPCKSQIQCGFSARHDAHRNKPESLFVGSISLLASAHDRHHAEYKSEGDPGWWQHWYQCVWTVDKVVEKYAAHCMVLLGLNPENSDPDMQASRHRIVEVSCCYFAVSSDGKYPRTFTVCSGDMDNLRTQRWSPPLSVTSFKVL